MKVHKLILKTVCLINTIVISEQFSEMRCVEASKRLMFIRKLKGTLSLACLKSEVYFANLPFFEVVSKVDPYGAIGAIW